MNFEFSGSVTFQFGVHVSIRPGESIYVWGFYYINKVEIYVIAVC